MSGTLRSGCVEVRQSGTVPVVTQVAAFAWRCGECGWVGIGLASEAAALREAATHAWEDHQVAICAPVDGKRQIGHPGHRWHYVKGSDSTEQCERCHDYIGK